MVTDPLAGLNEHQRQVVLTTDGPVLVLAGAGSGKTRALTHRIAYLLATKKAQPTEILAVTFTNKAAKEMRHRLAGLVGSAISQQAALGTFHSLGARLLREQPQYVGRSTSFTIADTSDSERLVKQALVANNFSIKEWSPRTVRQGISQAKNDLKTPELLLASATTPFEEVVAKTFAHYQTLLAQHDSFDFDDLIVETIRLLDLQPQLRQQYRDRWRYLSVDEYQDTNPAQDYLIRQLLGDHKNLCVVGDDYQAIYSWRGAKVDHILRFEHQFPGCTTIYLTQNYRSTPAILAAANAIIAENETQKHKELWTAQAPSTPVQLAIYQSDRQEAQHVRAAIQEHLQTGGRASDCAILYRTNAQSRLFEEELLFHRIPYTIVGGLRFYERAEVKDAMAFAQLLVNPNAALALQRVVGSSVRGIGPKTLAKLVPGTTEVSLMDQLATSSALSDRQRAALRSLYTSWREARDHEGLVDQRLRLFLRQSGYWRALREEPDGEDRSQNLEELLNVAARYQDLTTFVEEVALMSDIDEAPEQADRVWCMTFHAAKGLEFPRVFVVGCEEGLLPHMNCLNTTAELEEERRLLYVGMTRAREMLQLSYAVNRTVRGEYLAQLASRFLDALPEQVEQIEHAWPNDRLRAPTASLDDFLGSVVVSDGPTYTSYEVGDLFTHPQFGRGVIIQSSNSTVTAVFEGYGVKTIAVDTAA